MSFVSLKIVPYEKYQEYMYDNLRSETTKVSGKAKEPIGAREHPDSLPGLSFT